MRPELYLSGNVLSAWAEQAINVLKSVIIASGQLAMQRKIKMLFMPEKALHAPRGIAAETLNALNTAARQQRCSKSFGRPHIAHHRPEATLAVEGHTFFCLFVSFFSFSGSSCVYGPLSTLEVKGKLLKTSSLK